MLSPRTGSQICPLRSCVIPLSVASVKNPASTKTSSIGDQPGPVSTELGTVDPLLPKVFCGANCGFHRQLFAKLGGFDPRVAPCDDVAFTFALTGAAIPIVVEPKALISYRHRRTYEGFERQYRSYGLVTYRRRGRLAAGHEFDEAGTTTEDSTRDKRLRVEPAGLCAGRADQDLRASRAERGA